ncbi:putative LysR-family transcriptional regulator [Streptomyces ambofaciens ATCC 23877]|uniref:Putative LysR-family transcriptional regulator n=1 Tax=Streptomyces ambofaciens (strain ATCC 23877 / 3486 / DSM 40053 / JCM 4204 / NBRC 12836 / NRRL B-2516) TaxID=278992 RepID=Q1RRD0_STRA7|nr:LysR family transcriptional regulator [Streptomyces ambofaciens]AKZ53319.1 putative LysR-family transcriptional regulator [Streptomyces ambofaciens ATCC 23877]CAI78158.1 putative LysR-family transcriptional regulator [Streptomyces ambofaciens ATCC 23877]CAJ89215.1 putative LysR-family transcriptional regulator [Streptomyces ambofaciens ATCC 23877]
MDETRNRAAALELKHLRCLVAIVDTGSFTDAGIELGISQAAVSRNLLSLEKILGVRLLHRTNRTITPTTAGVQALVRARSLLSGAEELVTEASTGHSRLHIGHAWSAFGRHTTEFQRRWHQSHPETELRLIRHNSSTGGLAEGLCDLAVIRAPLDLKPWSHALVGHEHRYVALASDDPWARRRSIRMSEIPGRTLAIDRRTGTTTLDLWPEDERPAVEYTHDIDDWLAAIATGRCVGITPQATAAQYRRDGITYRPLRDTDPVPVHFIWRRQDPHPATHAAVALAIDLYGYRKNRHIPANSDK